MRPSLAAKSCVGAPELRTGLASVSHMDRSRTSPCWSPTSSANQSFNPAPPRKITGSARDDLPQLLPMPPSGRPLTSSSQVSQPRLPSFGQRTSVDRVPPAHLRPGTSAAPGGPVSTSWREGKISSENATLPRSPQEVNRVLLNFVPAPSGLQEMARASMENALLKFSPKERHSAPASQSKSMELVKASFHDVNHHARNTLEDSHVATFPSAKNASQVDRHALKLNTTPRMRIGSEPTRNTAGILFCGFCKKNGELASTYTAHSLRFTKSDGTTVVSCPVLRGLTCDICGATEDTAHTRSHCPKGVDCLPVAVMLKSTARRCDGTLRLKDQYPRKP